MCGMIFRYQYDVLAISPAQRTQTGGVTPTLLMWVPQARMLLKTPPSTSAFSP